MMPNKYIKYINKLNENPSVVESGCADMLT